MKVFFLTTAVVALSGCASIVSESKYRVEVLSEPRGANFEVHNKSGSLVATGSTPGRVTLNAGAGYFRGETYQVTYRKEGFSEQQSVINSGIDGWYWGNFIVGGPLGLLVLDPATGAMYTLPDSTSAKLQPLQATAAETAQQVAKPGFNNQSKESLLKELANDKSLSYEEYRHRYEIIMRQE